jgi:hypothetical protein
MNGEIEIVPGEGIPRGPLPISVLVQLYRFMRVMGQKERLEFARWLAKKPDLLGEWFRRSLARYGDRYSNASEPFRPVREELPDAAPVTNIKSGRDLAVVLADRPRGRWWDVAGAPELRFRFVDHELPPLRTERTSRFEDGSPSTAGMRADLLLVGEDGMPVVGEAKAATEERYDTDPVLALIQGLTLCAQLATPQQIDRLTHSYKDAQFDARGLLGLYVIVVKPAQAAPAEHQAELYEAARSLAEAIRGHQALHVVSRLAFIEARWNGQLELQLAPPPQV